MKHINKIFFIIVIIVISYGCKKSFLDLQPKDQLSIETTFAAYEPIKLYAWQFYEVFPGYAGSVTNSEINSDMGAFSFLNGESPWIWQTMIVPTSSSDYTTPFKNIRAINLLLDNVDNAAMTDAEKKHWRSVGYFFKAFNYADLVNKYGDITWVENSLKDDDQATLFGPRTPRNEVTQKILDMLTYAETNIKPAGDGANTINVNVVRALISRFGLTEGTWRKYHGITDAAKYLQASADASQKLVAAFPNIIPNYWEVFNSASLAGKPGILLYKLYEKDQVTHTASTFPKSSSGRWDITRKAMDMYLMKDGQTRWTSPLFQGDDTPFKEFRDRDIRLYFTTPPPYKVNAPGSIRTFTFTANPEEQEFFPVLENLTPGDESKRLPMRNWNGFVVRKTPHFQDNNDGQPYNVTFTGYQLMKFASRLNEGISSADINDAPIFRIEEVMLNYAEAMFELGGFTQTICNATINKLRARGKVAGLNIAAIIADPKRDPSVDPVLWEIRRERTIELMGEGFRFDDLRRWKKMDYATERKLGMFLTVKAGTTQTLNCGEVPPNTVPTLGGRTVGSSGYVAYEGIPPTPFKSYYYLYPIPSNEVVITNDAVKQNPGW